MKRLVFALTLQVLVASFFTGQEVKIKDRSVAKKAKYNTTVFLTDGEKVNGTLGGLTDTTLTLSYTYNSPKGIIYEFKEYKYDVISAVKIKKKANAAVMLTTAGVAGLTGLYLTAYGGNEITVAATFGSAMAGGLVAYGLNAARNRAYRFEVNGDLTAYRYHLSQLQLMVVDQ